MGNGSAISNDRSARANTLASLAPKTRVCFCRITLPGKAQQLISECCQKVRIKVEFYLPNLQLWFGQCNMY
jgi:hypothetical protein